MIVSGLLGAHINVIIHYSFIQKSLIKNLIFLISIITIYFLSWLVVTFFCYFNVLSKSCLSTNPSIFILLSIIAFFMAMVNRMALKIGLP